MTARAPRSPVPSIRPASGWVLGGFVGLHTIVLTVVHGAGFARVVSGPLYEWTDGWMSPVLTATLLMAIIIVGGWFGFVGGLRRRDLGLPTGWDAGWKLLNAVLMTYLLWGVAQLVVVGGGLAGLTSVVMNPAWVRPLNPEWIGASIVTVIAAAALEEVMYRGFLFVHLLLALRRWGVPGRWGPMAGALIGSQALFGLNHIPAGRVAGLEGTMLLLYVLQVTLVGILFVVLFLQTRNLLLVIAVHALINNPELPFVADVNASFVVLVTVLGLMLARPLLMRVFSGIVGPPGPSSGVRGEKGSPFSFTP